MKGYEHPEVLVSTQWVADHLGDSDVRVVESNEDILLYDLGHIPGAVQIDWQKDLNDAVRRDYLTRERFEELMSASGIANDYFLLERVRPLEEIKQRIEQTTADSVVGFLNRNRFKDYTMVTIGPETVALPTPCAGD